MEKLFVLRESIFADFFCGNFYFAVTIFAIWPEIRKTDKTIFPLKLSYTLTQYIYILFYRNKEQYTVASLFVSFVQLIYLFPIPLCKKVRDTSLKTEILSPEHFSIIKSHLVFNHNLAKLIYLLTADLAKS